MPAQAGIQRGGVDDGIHPLLQEGLGGVPPPGGTCPSTLTLGAGFKPPLRFAKGRRSPKDRHKNAGDGCPLNHQTFAVTTNIIGLVDHNF